MKKLFLLLLFLCSTQIFAQGAFGSGGDLEPLGPYPIVKQKFIQGGLHVLSDTSLLASYLRDSVMVYQKGDSKFYRWESGVWAEVATGSAGWQYPDLTPSTYLPGAGAGDTLAAFANAYSPGGRAYIIGANIGGIFSNQGLEFNANGVSTGMYFFNKGAAFFGGKAAGPLESLSFQGSSINFRSGSTFSVDNYGLYTSLTYPNPVSGYRGLFVTNASGNASIDSIRLNADDNTYLPRVLISELVEDSLDAFLVQIPLVGGNTDTIFKFNQNGSAISHADSMLVYMDNSNFYASALTYKGLGSVRFRTNLINVGSEIGGDLNLSPNSISSNFSQGLSIGNQGPNNFGKVNIGSSQATLRGYFYADSVFVGTPSPNSSLEALWLVSGRVENELYSGFIQHKLVTKLDTTVEFRGNWKDHTGTLLSNGQTLVSNGTNMVAKNISESISHTEELDFPAIASGNVQSLSFTVPNTIVGDVVVMTPDKGAFTDNLQFQCWVNGANTVVVQAYNYTGAAIDPGSNSFHFKILK